MEKFGAAVHNIPWKQLPNGPWETWWVGKHDAVHHMRKELWSVVGCCGWLSGLRTFCAHADVWPCATLVPFGTRSRWLFLSKWIFTWVHSTLHQMILFSIYFIFSLQESSIYKYIYTYLYIFQYIITYLLHSTSIIFIIFLSIQTLLRPSDLLDDKVHRGSCCDAAPWGELGAISLFPLHPIVNTKQNRWYIEIDI